MSEKPWTGVRELDFGKPKLGVRPGPGQQRIAAWVEPPDKIKMEGGVYWAADMQGSEDNDVASFTGNVGG